MTDGVPRVSVWRRLGQWFRAQHPWHLVTVILGLTTATFCVLWLKDFVPAEQLPEWVSALSTAGALVAADAWAASHAEEPKDRALARVRFLRLVKLSADLALHDAVDNARGAGASWAGIGSALGTSRQTAHQRFTD